MSEQQQETEAQLTLKDRLNFPYILANQILTFQKSLLAEEYSEREIIESIKGFLAIIPSDWNDEHYKKELEKAKTKKKVDKRPIAAGRTRVSIETCEKLGIPAFVEEEHIDYYKVLNAIVNLLNRRKMISRIDRIEKLEGIELESNLEKSEVWESDLLDKQG